MAKKITQTPIDITPTELIISKTNFISTLNERIATGMELFNREIRTETEFESLQNDFYSWTDYNGEFLKHAFNKEENEYRKNYNSIGSFSFGLGGYTSPQEELKRLKSKIGDKVEGLKRLLAKTDLLKSNITDHNSNSIKAIELNTSQVFIVHGHDDAAKTMTARFVEKLGFQPIILHEQASSGKTIIEKIEEYSSVGFGIVLYTPCDIGAKHTENPSLKSRARQNVVFEHGYLIGKIGRNKVCALVKGDIETPNDISGVVYINMDNDEAWHLKLAKELRSAGYSVDLNKL